MTELANLCKLGPFAVSIWLRHGLKQYLLQYTCLISTSGLFHLYIKYLISKHLKIKDTVPRYLNIRLHSLYHQFIILIIIIIVTIVATGQVYLYFHEPANLE